MQNCSVKKKSFLHLLPLVTVLLLFTALMLFAFFGAADEPAPEIQNVAYQTVTGDSLESPTTTLRFLFTVNSLGYSKVGFVFSKSNPDPTVDGDGCYVFETTSVHSSVWANGKKTDAPDGRYWVGVKLTNIPNSAFSTPIYVKAYVRDGSGVRYASVRDLSVCGAFGHVDPVGGRILSAPTATDAGRQEYVCDRCGDVVWRVDTDAYESTIATLQTQVASFSNSDFGGGSITTNLAAAAGKSYTAPPVNPVASHPRVLFTESDVARINETLSDATHVSAASDYLGMVEDPVTGILPAASSQSNGYHNYNADTLTEIQALAMEYQLTGNKIAGYQAVYAIKNYIKTLNITRINSDQCRQYGNVMFTAACVYDWCHDLLTSSDKEQIVLGIEKKICTGSNSAGAKMEIGFPPKSQQAMTGHGAERQLLRDYLSFAIAIYDEYPGWWSFIGGRFYSEFVPVRNAYYAAGYVPQGLSNYLSMRFSADLWSAWLIKSATGSLPYTASDMKQVMRTAYSNVTNGYDRVFEEGDDGGSSSGEILNQLAFCGMMSGYLFDDDTAMSWADFRNYAYVDAVSYLILQSGNAVGNKNNRYDGMDLILYNGSWLGQMITHSNWAYNGSATVKMKIGGRMTGNHDHADAGSFQLYYKGYLAGDSGCYDEYESTHHLKYHQATIAHNSIVLQTGSTVYGQKQPDEVGSLSDWAGNSYQTGTVTGVSYAYADPEETEPIYAYLAGDVSRAYVASANMTRLDRRMLAVYATDDPTVPLYFFVFDDIVSSSTSYKKIFLLHTKNEPTVNGKTVTTTHEDGKLVLQNVLGGDSITKVGGSGHNYDVGGYQKATAGGEDDKYWGRVEISPTTGSAENILLNVMYVCHKDDSPSRTATLISTSEVKGAVIGNTAAVFVTSASRRSSEFTFTASGEGYVNYYVSGVSAGNWKVVVGGKTVAFAVATEEGGFLTFTAPAGTPVTLRPGAPNLSVDDALPENEWPSFTFDNVLP